MTRRRRVVGSLLAMGGGVERREQDAIKTQRLASFESRCRERYVPSSVQIMLESSPPNLPF
jgi:hypothetical protein